jgi:lipopolysaccharide transport system ATP-binding protein
MKETAILVDGLSKRYRIGLRQKKFPTLRDSLTSMIRPRFRSGSGKGANASDSDLWALKDVSFEILQGEVTGVIGRNGAGKSTLLKILSRITDPTEGFAEIHGRVGSLLEVGTGFHPELTGRENVYLNGAILGMRRTEIDRKFDEIVSFAEVERFLDTPVKHYSTGMFMRLAFSVAAHLDPEILLVDEVLAVGDAEFQKKCLGKMDGVAKQGRTVLFVSHNMPAVQSLCSRCVVLRDGKLEIAGSVHAGIRLYHAGAQDMDLESVRGEAAIGNLRVNGSVTPHVAGGSAVCFEFDLALRAEICGFRLILVLESSQGTTVLHAVRTERDLQRLGEPGTYRISLTIPPMSLTPGAYSFYTKFIYNGVNLGGRYVSDKTVVMFAGDYSPDSAPGLLSPSTDWNVEPVELRMVGTAQPIAV